MSAASVMKAPGPVETRSGTGFPVTRAYPSAAKPAFSSLTEPEDAQLGRSQSLPQGKRMHTR